jgi:hypothetical protein
VRLAVDFHGWCAAGDELDLAVFTSRCAGYRQSVATRCTGDRANPAAPSSCRRTGSLPRHVALAAAAASLRWRPRAKQDYCGNPNCVKTHTPPRLVIELTIISPVVAEVGANGP